MLECEFAEIEDVGVALPDCARRMPATVISSPDNPGLTARLLYSRPRAGEAYLWLVSVACSWLIVWSRSSAGLALAGTGPTAGSPLQQGQQTQLYNTGDQSGVILYTTFII